MPKAITKNTVFARHEPIGLIERIDISKETQEKFKDVCKWRPLLKPKKVVVHTKPAHPDSLERTIAHLIEKAVDSRILMRQRRLQERLSNPIPLADRLTDSRPLSERLGEFEEEMAQEYPALPALDFKKKFRQDRIREFKNVLKPVNDRLTPVFVWLDTDEAKGCIKEEDYGKLWDWFERLQDIEIHIDVVGHQWKKSKPWRDLRGACKAIKNVDFRDFNRRKIDIAKELLEKRITIPDFVVPK